MAQPRDSHALSDSARQSTGLAVVLHFIENYLFDVQFCLFFSLEECHFSGIINVFFKLRCIVPYNPLFFFLIDNDV